MPRFDGTGPMGMGPMTGGGRGFCVIPLHPAWPTYAKRRFATPYAASWGAPYYGVPSFTPQTAKEDELDYLKGLAQSMKEDLEKIEQQIKKIESKTD